MSGLQLIDEEAFGRIFKPEPAEIELLKELDEGLSQDESDEKTDQ